MGEGWIVTGGGARIPVSNVRITYQRPDPERSTAVSPVWRTEAVFTVTLSPAAAAWLEELRGGWWRGFIARQFRGKRGFRFADLVRPDRN